MLYSGLSIRIHGLLYVSSLIRVTPLADYVESIAYIRLYLFCMEEDMSTCLTSEPYNIQLPGCMWEDDLQSYFMETCSLETGALTYATYTDAECTSIDTTVGSRYGWADLELCDAT